MAQPVSDTIATFFAKYPLQTFDKRQLIINSHDRPTHVFYIVEGWVNQYDITPAGNEVVVNVFKPGAFFPMSSAIHATPSTYFYEANTPTRAHRAPADDAVAFLKTSPDVLFDLLARVYRGMDGVLRRMAHLMGGDARSRLTFELLNAAYRFGEAQSDGSIRIPLKEGELAKRSGLARETVNRCLQNLKAAGLVDVGANGIVIEDIRQLEAALGTSL